MIIELANFKTSQSRALYCTANSLSGPLILGQALLRVAGGLAALNIADLEGGEL